MKDQEFTNNEVENIFMSPEEESHINNINPEVTPQDNKEFDMQLEALESGQFLAQQAAIEPTQPHDSNLAEKYEANRGLDKNQIRNFWYSKRELSQSFSSNHSTKNAEEIFKLFSSGAKKDDWHASMAESCAYRDMVDCHKKESKDTTVDNYETIVAQHKVEVALFDVYKGEMLGKEPDTTELDQAFDGYEKVTERAARKERIAQRALESKNDPGSISTRDTSKYRSPHAQVKHIDPTELETRLKQINRLGNYQGKIASLRSQHNQ